VPVLQVFIGVLTIYPLNLSACRCVRLKYCLLAGGVKSEHNNKKTPYCYDVFLFFGQPDLYGQVKIVSVILFLFFNIY